MLEVARRAQVALSTVSYALNGTRPISEKTRQRIFAAMDELGYHPRGVARGPGSKRSKIVALLFPNRERGLGITELEFVTSATEAARQQGYQLILWTSDVQDIGELRKFTQQGLVEGVVLMEVCLTDDRVSLLRRLEFPFSMIGRCEDLRDDCYVDVDFGQSTQVAVNFLVQLGHRKIGFVNQSKASYELGYGAAVRSQAGFQKAMDYFGLQPVTKFCRTAPQAGNEVFKELLAEHPDLTALIVMNERAIPGIYQAIAEQGWSIPEDFSVVGILSSAHVAEMTSPPLTTLDIQAQEMGRMGVELLIQQLEGQPAQSCQKLIPCVLNIRSSTGICHRKIPAQETQPADLSA